MSTPTPATQPKVLLLDVMSTLVHDPIFDAVPAFFETDVRDLLSTLDRDVWFAFERGEITEARYFETCFRDRRAVDGPGFRQAMAGGYAWLPGVEALLGRLKAAGVAMYALSNYPQWWALIEAKLGLGRFLEWRFVSCNTGLRKPDPEAYLGPARSLGVAPADCLFVDDRRSNVEAAESVGMAGHRFQGSGALEARLGELGFL